MLLMKIVGALQLVHARGQRVDADHPRGVVCDTTMFRVIVMYYYNM